MGNVDSRCKQKGGYMFVQTEKPFYEPGDEIKGKIYLRLDETVKAEKISMWVRGREKVKWKDTEYEGEGENRKAVKVSRKHKKEYYKSRRTFISLTMILKQVTMSSLSNLSSSLESLPRSTLNLNITPRTSKPRTST